MVIRKYRFNDAEKLKKTLDFFANIGLTTWRVNIVPNTYDPTYEVEIWMPKGEVVEIA